MRLIPAALFASVTQIALPAAAGPFDGLYYPGFAAPGSWDCTSVGSDGGALEITETSFAGVESLCTLSDPVEVRGMEAVLYDASCSGEGETTAERIMLMTHAEGVYLIRPGLVLDLLACP